MTDNITQFAPLFHAAGAKLNLITDDLRVEIVDYPKGKKTIVNNATEEISHYIDTRTITDGLAIFGICEYFDGDPNPIDKNTRRRILDAVGMTKEGKYITQVIALQKVNKSWHLSEIPNECSWFGDVCTHRGVVDIPGKRGRKATRSPDEYHKRKSNGLIDREQCVTPALEALWRAIPEEVMVSTTKKNNLIYLDAIETLDLVTLQALKERISKVIG